MSRRFGIIFVLGLLVVATGCVARPGAEQPSSPQSVTTRPATRDIAMLALDQIEPQPTLATPATAPSTPAPLEAIELFARGRASLLQNQRYTAVTLLERAADIDPHSFEIAYSLGRAYLAAGMADKSLDAFTRAAQLKPDDLDVQAELGRAYFNRGESDRAIEHLRLARQTGEYHANDVTAAVVDYRLAVALQQRGYDRAALEVYDGLARRLQYPSPQMRGSAEVAYLLSRPEAIVEEVAKLHEKHEQYEPALRARQFIAQRAPDDLAAHAKVIHLLIEMRRGDEAIARAAELVRRFRASAEALVEFRETYRKLGRTAELIRELRALRAERPDDRSILFALADALEAAGRGGEAESLLSRAIDDRAGDPEIVARLVQVLAQRGQVLRAARVLIEAAAQHPAHAAALEAEWVPLLAPGRLDALRVEPVRELEVSADARAAKLYYLHHVMRAWSREMSAREALEQSTRIAPPFPPAFRALTNMIWASPARSVEDQIEQTRTLIDAARAAGNALLADEIEGLMLLAQKQAEAAVTALARATADRPPPEALFALATAHRVVGNDKAFEQLAWRIISDHPRFADAAAALCRYYLDHGQLNAARRVLSVWRANIPDDVNARLLEATLHLRVSNAPQRTEDLLLDLFQSSADNATVLANLRAFFSETSRVPRFVEMLEEEVARRPHNVVAVAQLADLYESQDRPADAARVLDAARDALIEARDAERLYIVSHLYQRIDQRDQTEQTLLDVLKIDPAFAPAGNDLGYTWADAGQHLDRAEALIRRAVEAEPNNPMFLDSLGWVLYKRGRFDEARRHLEQAVTARRYDDPVVLDHLGDALYQLNQRDEAAKQWQQGIERLGVENANEREDLKALRLVLNQKLKQASAGEPVSVAPVVESGGRPNQAKRQAAE